MLVAAFVAYPFASIAAHSLTRWDGITPAQYVGFHNFRVLWRDPIFRLALRNNVLFALSVPIQVVVPLLVAYAIHLRIPGWRLFRATVFLPAVYATVVIGILSVDDAAARRAGQRRRSGRVGLQSLEREWLGLVDDVDPRDPADRRLDELRLQRPALRRGHERARSRRSRRPRGSTGRGAMAVLRHIVVPNLRRVLEIVLVINTITAFAFMFAYIYTITNGGPGLRHLRLRVLHLRAGVHEPEPRLRVGDRHDADRARARHRDLPDPRC